MPTADGAISLISFTVHRVGAGGTQLLAGAAVNYILRRIGKWVLRFLRSSLQVDQLVLRLLMVV